MVMHCANQQRRGHSTSQQYQRVRGKRLEQQHETALYQAPWILLAVPLTRDPQAQQHALLVLLVASPKGCCALCRRRLTRRVSRP